MGEFSPWHLLIVAAVFVLLFGSKRLPESARSLGRSLRILKAETAELREDRSGSDAAADAAPVAAPVAAGALAAPVPVRVPAQTPAAAPDRSPAA